MAKVLDLRIIKSPPSAATVEALSSLLTEARAGRLVGIAFVAVYRGSSFDTEAVGKALDAPLLTRTMLRDLDDRLAKLTRGS